MCFSKKQEARKLYTQDGPTLFMDTKKGAHYLLLLASGGGDLSMRGPPGHRDLLFDETPILLQHPNHILSHSQLRIS